MSELTDDVLSIITKNIMLDYETIRKSGITNMFDYFAVVKFAKRLQMKELSQLTLAEYKVLLMNFGRLMQYYNVVQ
jgi:hypothetical protein